MKSRYTATQAPFRPPPKERREQIIDRVFREWDEALSRSDADALLALYAPDAVLESPLIPHLLGKEVGICTGHGELRRLFELLRERKPPVRQHYRSGYLSDGKKLIWEYPRATPEGDQMDFVEAMEINEEGLIQHHNVYWGWFGVRVLQRNEYHKHGEHGGTQPGNESRGAKEIPGHTRGKNAMHTMLAASARSAEIPEAMDFYGFLIGSWELDVIGYESSGNVVRSAGEAHFAWVLEGRAVQDVFINPRRSDRGPNSPKFGNWFGTTLRIYDPRIEAWRVNWFNPHDGIRAELIGSKRGEDIVQEGTFSDGTPIRWTFSEITESSCRWRGERLERDGKTWRLQVEFDARRTA